MIQLEKIDFAFDFNWKFLISAGNLEISYFSRKNNPNNQVHFWLLLFNVHVFVQNDSK